MLAGMPNTRFNSPDEYQAQKQVDAFLAYWKALPREPGRIIPHLRTLLDQAEPKLQRSIALLDVMPPLMLAVRLFGTEREAVFGQDPTHTNALDSFEPHLREPVFSRVLCVVGQPVGWLNQRGTLSTRGTVYRHLALNLPLAVDSGAAPCIVNFSTIIDQYPNAKSVPQVNALFGCEWVDIGAGTPSLSPSF